MALKTVKEQIAAKAIETNDGLDPKAVLSNLGMDTAEISVYQTMLALGSKPASAIAVRAGLKRGQTYNVLDRLVSLGLVQEGIRNGVRHFSCSHPRTLLSLLDQRENELKLQRERVLDIIPQLEGVRRSYSGSPRIRLFQGIAGAMEVLEEMLEDQGDLLAVVDARTVFLNKCQGNTTSSWHNEYADRRARRGKGFYGLVNVTSDEDCDGYLAQSGAGYLRKIKLVSGMPLNGEIIISADKLGLLATVGETVSILIENKNISQVGQQMFWSLWRTMPDYCPNVHKTMLNLS